MMAQELRVNYKVGDHILSTRMIRPTKALNLSDKMTPAIAVALSPLLVGEDDADATKMVDELAKAVFASGLAEEITNELIGVTTVDDSKELSKVFDAVFLGRLSDIHQWRVKAFWHNFGGFFLGLLEKLKDPQALKDLLG